MIRKTLGWTLLAMLVGGVVTNVAASMKHNAGGSWGAAFISASLFFAIVGVVLGLFILAVNLIDGD